MFTTDLLAAPSLDALRDRIRQADDRTVLNAGACIAAEIDGCLTMGTTPSQWDEERFEVLYAESVRRGSFA